MPKRTTAVTPKNHYADMQCSLARSLNLVGDRWSPLILRDLSYGPQRFEDLADDLGVARNLLTSRLTRLVEADVVTRTLYQEHPPRYHYELSDAGRELAPVLMALTAWGDKWATPESGPPIAYRHDTSKCKKAFTPTVSCSECGEEVILDVVEIVRGPGKLLGRGTMLAAAFIERRQATRQATR
jgi:DNA-binding HxlR family transcriptional regulator